ncbi:MAG TPA: ATP-binding protein [Bacteroidales bacterium]|jgi:hypothetical protein|nr:ATP-binding protein [Bacteroidales bacterium]
MDYSTTYFNKPLGGLTYQDIVDYFVDAKEESIKIEFKAFSARYGNFTENLNGVIRGICAFLNSEGGILIWGAPEGVQPQGQPNKVFQGTLSPLTELKEKDWLINKISDLITPLPVGIDVVILQNATSIVYIFEIQPSNYSPHQFKNTYWARLDGQTRPAPHYLIEALFKRIRYPNIEGFIKPEEIAHNGVNYFLDITIFIFNFTPLQNEENISFRLMCQQGIFSRSQDPNFTHMYLYDGHQLIFKDFIDVLHFGAPNMHRERLVFNPHELSSKYGNKVKFLLSFGGKHSPLKTSSYSLDFGKIDWNKAIEPNYLFTKIEENVLSADKQKELGATREDLLRNILKR